MAIQYGKRKNAENADVWEQLSTMEVTFPYGEGGEPFLSARSRTVLVTPQTQNSAPVTRLGLGRVGSVNRGGPQNQSRQIPILGDDGLPTGKTISIGEFFQAAESLYVFLLQEQDGP